MQATLSSDLQLVEGLLGRIGGDLGMILDRTITFADTRCERQAARAVGEGQIHVSFRVDVRGRTQQAEGCLLVPLPDAMTLAACLMMASEEEVVEARAAAYPDASAKDALLEIDNFVASACDAVVRDLDECVSIQPAGCQGVRADVRPALDYEEGSELLVARSQAQVADFEPFELLLMLPAFALPEGS